MEAMERGTPEKQISGKQIAGKQNAWSVYVNPITRESLMLPLSKSKAHLVHRRINISCVKNMK